MTGKTDTQQFRIRQQLEDREAVLKQLILDMKRRGEIEAMIQPFQEDIRRIHQNLMEMKRVESQQQKIQSGSH